jgi:hypothetical protein
MYDLGQNGDTKRQREKEIPHSEPHNPGFWFIFY